MGDKIISREQIKKYSEEIETILRENPNLKNRDKILKEMFGQSSKRKEILELLNRKKNTEYVFIGKILILATAGKDFFSSLDFYQSENSYYFLEEEEEYSKFLKFIDSQKNFCQDETKNQKSEWENKLEKLNQIKIKIKKNADSEKLYKFFKIKENENIEFLIEQIATDNFYKNCEMLYKSKIEGYNKDKYENAEFLDHLKDLLDSRTEIIEILEITNDKIGDFKNLYKLCKQFPEKKVEYINMKWQKLKEEAKCI